MSTLQNYTVWQAEDEEGEASILARQMVVDSHSRAARQWAALVEREATQDEHLIAAAGCPIDVVVKELESGEIKTFTVSGEYVATYSADETT